MGGNSSKKDAERGRGAEYIDCNPYIDVADINYELQERKPYLQKSSIYVFRKAANVVAVNPDYIFRNCEIRLVDGNDLYVIFYAGSRGNVYVVTNNNGMCEAICKERSLGRIIREGAASVFRRIGQFASVALGLASTVMKAITY